VAVGLVPHLSVVASTDEVPKEDTKKVDEAPKEDTKNVINMIQWLSIISIVVSLIGLYYKREEIKNVFNRQPATPQPAAEMQAPVDTRPVEAMSVRRRGLRPMD